MNRGNLGQMLQQLIMNKTAPTTTITSDGNGNTKESTKITWDGFDPHNFRPESQGPSITASPTNEQFAANQSGIWDDFSGWAGDRLDDGRRAVDSLNEKLGIGLSPTTHEITDTGLLAGDEGTNADGTPTDYIHNSIGGKAWPQYGPDGLFNPYASGRRKGSESDAAKLASTSGGSGGRGALGNALRREEDLYLSQGIYRRDQDKRPSILKQVDPDDILGGGKPKEDAETAAEKKARINEKFKNVTGGDYSIKEVEKSIEKAGNNYQDTLLERYGDYDFAKKASEERKERLRRTNRVVMQGFMLDVMSQALGKKVGSQNYVENALKALETDFEIGNEDQLQEVTKALYFRPDGTYDPPASKNEAFQALTMMGIDTDEAAAISGKVSESKEYYVKDASNPSGYRITREKPGANEEYTTDAALADKKYGTNITQTQAELDKGRARELENHQKEFPRNSDGYMDEDTKKRLRARMTFNTGTIPLDFFDSLPEGGHLGSISIIRAIRHGNIDKNSVIGFGSYEEAIAHASQWPNGLPYVALYKGPNGQSLVTIMKGDK